MAPFDRETALKNAEKAIKLGKVDAAIAEYVKVVESHPRDWNSANALGDLYVRAKQIEKGVQQYTRIAEHLAEEGFYPKAAALFKKILKIKPDDEYSLLQSGDLAAKSGKLVDAKQYFNQVMERRTKRGDKKGATEIAIRLGTLDPEDFESRMNAAKLAIESGDTTTALREYKDIAARLEKLDKFEAALVPLKAAYDLDKTDDKLRGRLFTAYLGGDPASARPLARGADDLQQVADALREGRQPRRRPRSARRNLGRRSGEPRDQGQPRAGAHRARRARQGQGLPLARNRRHQSGAVDDACRDRAARPARCRRQGRGAAGVEARSQPGPGRGRARLQARGIRSGRRIPGV